MQDLGKIHQLIINLPGHQVAINLEVVLMSWIVFFILIVFGYLTAHKRTLVPRPMQVLGELLIDQLYSLTEDALDKKGAQKYGPMVCALFLFLLTRQLRWPRFREQYNLAVPSQPAPAM